MSIYKLQMIESSYLYNPYQNWLKMRLNLINQASCVIMMPNQKKTDNVH